MADLSLVTPDEIRTNIMSILYTHMDTIFTQNVLFNKLLEDKFDKTRATTTNTIHPRFKANFLLVLRTLMSKYDDICVTKDDKNIFSVICYSSSDKQNTKEWIDVKKEVSEISKEEISKEETVQYDKIDYNNLIDFIIENNLNSEFNYIDPFDGNTIFHDLVITNNIIQITKLINEKKFNYVVKNKHEQTPGDLSKNNSITQIILTGLTKKIISDLEFYDLRFLAQSKIITNYEEQRKIYESKEYKNNIIKNTGFIDIFIIKIYDYFAKNFVLILPIIIVLISIKYLF